MEAQLQELVYFLRDKNPQVRQIALSNLLPQTAKDAPYRNIFFVGLKGSGLQQAKENDIIKDLKLLCRDQPATAHDAFRALVNLSDSALLVNTLSEPSFLNFIVSYIINPHSVLADLASMMLSNLTSSSVACSALLSLKVSVIIDSNFPGSLYPTQSRCGTCPAPVPYPSGESREVLALPLLIDAFVSAAGVNPSSDPSKRSHKGDLHFLASVFANVTASPTGRNFFFEPRASNVLGTGALEFPLSKIVSFTEHKDTIRRKGIVSTLKNCAFHVPGHVVFLSPETVMTRVSPSTVEAPGIDGLQYLLLPLAGPEELDLEDQERLLPTLQFLPPTKTREPDPTIRLTHVETLLLLCHTRWGRDYLREHGVYEIVRATHENETVDKISEHIERLVNLLKGVEPEHSIDEVDKANEAGVETNQNKASIMTDDEDDRIEEV